MNQEKTRISIIDGDTMVWVAAYGNREQDGTADMLTGLDTFLTELLINTKADGYIGLIKGREPSHRAKLFADYKGNRPPAPEWLGKWKPAIEEHLTTKWGFEFVNGVETDDAVVSVAYILYEKYGHEPIICSVDKDFNQYPGWHYNPRTKELKDISAEEAYIFLATQLLTGDATDNIKGIPGVGPAKAQKILQAEGITKSINLFERVIAAYMSFHADMPIGLLDFAENAIKIILKIDKSYPINIREVPQYIKQPLTTEDLFNTPVDSNLN